MLVQRFWYLVRGVCLSHGLLFVAAGSMVFWQSYRSLDWPEIPARVVQSNVMEREWLGTTVFWPEVFYQYEQNGNYKSSQSIAFFGMAPYVASLLSDRAMVEKMIAEKYALDSTVKVRMNPINPGNVVLEVKLLSFGFLFSMGLGMALLYLAWLVLMHMKHMLSLARVHT